MKKFLLLVLLLPHTQTQAVDCVAHRGDSEAFLENSLRALKSAIDLQVDAVEFDVQHDRQGVPLLLHDGTLERTARSRKGRVCPLKTPIQELAFASIEKNCELKNGEAIPTLHQALELLAPTSLTLLVEFKDRPSLQTLTLLRLFFQQHKERLRLISFLREGLEVPWEAEEDRAFWQKLKKLHLLQAFLPWLKVEHGVDVMDLLRNADLLKSHKNAGRETGLWTIDSKRRLEELMPLEHVDFVTTNRPRLCMTLKSEWQQSQQ